MHYRSTLFAAVLVTVLLAIGATVAYLYMQLGVVTLEMLQDDLRARSLLVSRVLASRPAEEWQTVGGLDPLVDEIAAELGGRVTLVAKDGRVLADSAADGVELLRMENHAARPEISAALRSGQGFAFRSSSTVRDMLLYVARRLPEPPGGVVRLAMPTFEISLLWDKVRNALGVGSLLGLLLAIGLSAFAGRLARQPIARLASQARILARTDRPRPPQEDEVQDLSRTLDALSRELQVLMEGMAHQREHLASIVCNLTAGLLLLDSKGKIVLTNPALRQLLEVQGETVGRSTAELVRNPQLLLAIEAALERREAGRLKFELRTSTQHFLEASVVPMETPSFGGALVLFYDVTRQERIEKIRQDFVANASHELRTPVSSISACAESLLQVPPIPEAQRQRFLEMIQRNAGRLARLGQDLLELARAEDDRERYHPAPTSLTEVVGRVESELRESLAEKNLTIQRDFTPEAGWVLADPDGLERVLTNLLENAIRYSPIGSAITVRSRASGEGKVLVEVEDHGEGIPEMHLGRIFERFYRIDRARSRRDGGTGLGLAIVKHVIEAQNGRVWASSRPGVSTVLSLELPAISPP